MQSITITIRANGEHVDINNEAQVELIAHRVRQMIDRLRDEDLITLNEIEVEVNP